MGRSVPVDTRPVWLLDVDGVLNAHHPGWDRPSRSGFARALGGHFRITWAPQVVEALWALDARVEVRWASTWVDWIDQIEGLLGLPAWPPAFAHDGSPAVGAHRAKLTAALGVVEGECRPLIWTDDDAIPEDSRTLRRLTTGRAPALLIRPHPAKGLQPEHLAAIERFVAGCEAG